MRTAMTKKEMKKEKHPVYRALLALCFLALALGVFLFVCSFSLGGDRVVILPGRAV